jgi:hypothetical protein
VSCASQLETTADNRTFQDDHDRDAPEFDIRKDTVPETGVLDPRDDIPLTELGEVEAGRKMLPFPLQDDRPDGRRQ